MSNIGKFAIGKMSYRNAPIYRIDRETEKRFYGPQYGSSVWGRERNGMFGGRTQQIGKADIAAVVDTLDEALARINAARQVDESFNPAELAARDAMTLVVTQRREAVLSALRGGP